MQAQLDAWAPAVIDRGRWAQRLSASYALVAEEAGRVAGFASLLEDGCVDMFYVSADHQSRGVGARLLSALEAEAKRNGLTRLYSDVSLTARRFFLRSNFVIQREYDKTLDSLVFRNAIMTKEL